MEYRLNFVRFNQLCCILTKLLENYYHFQQAVNGWLWALDIDITEIQAVIKECTKIEQFVIVVFFVANSSKKMVSLQRLA